jgi:hypothetical protein
MGSPNDIIVPIPVHVNWELEHFSPKVVGRGRWMEAPGSAVLDPFSLLSGRLESVLQYAPQQRNDGRPGRLVYWGLQEEIDAVFLPGIAEPTELPCCSLQCRRSPGLRHIDKAHPFEHQ